ncbi:MAG: NAD(P)/FAD-dependent oxidoreductase [Nitrospinae bacterium]|nr:NAD(P)/FAD-dependent oxidoreductase [Nitrospinota bacterium]
MSKELKLKDGSVVAIIGGGPSGTSCAINLKKESIRMGIDLKIVLFEGKDFDYLYNQCVGVLSPPFERILTNELGVEFPSHLIKRRIEGYVLYGNGNKIFLNGNENEGPTYAVRRIEFDNFMLDTVRRLGVDVRKNRTTYVEFIEDKVRIFGERGYLKADVVVGAFGLDESMLGVFEKATKDSAGYKRPKRLLRSYITKIFARDDFIDRKLGNYIYAFIPGTLPNVEFGAVTPKKGHIMVNVAGRNVHSTDLIEFLKLSKVMELLPPSEESGEPDYFEGMFPASTSQNPFGDRFVMVGDATGWLRPFKGKGINTAFITGIKAAETMLKKGISKKDFEQYAIQCQSLTDDYVYGSIARNTTHIFSSIGIFDKLIDVARYDKKLYDGFYNAVSGHDSYKNIFKKIMTRKTIFNITKGLIFSFM